MEERLEEVKELIAGYIKDFNDGPCKCGGCSIQSILSSCEVIHRAFNMNYRIILKDRSFLIDKIFFENEKTNFYIWSRD